MSEERWYKTTIQIEVISEGVYDPNTLSEIRQDITDGPHLGIWEVKESDEITPREVIALIKAYPAYVSGRDLSLDDIMAERYKRPVAIDWWLMKMPLRGPEGKASSLWSSTKEELVHAIIDYQYNQFCRTECNRKKVVNSDPYGKNIPYIGWFWRTIDFSTDIPIGKTASDDIEGPGFVGFMANNKWGYPERSLTEAERRQVTDYLDKAMMSNSGVQKEAALKELWDYMQTLTIE